MFSFIYLSLKSFSTSTKGVKRLSKKERKALSLNNYLNEVLVGLLLGDGHIQRRSLTANSRFMYSQTVKHEVYFNSIYALFKPFCTSSFTSFTTSHLNKETKVINSSLTFATMALPIFNSFHESFYVNKVKIIPKNIFDLLIPVGLAFWIMDDGSKHNNGLHLNVYGFSTPDVELLLTILNQKFDLKCSIHMKAHQCRIYIYTESMDSLKELVLSHMHPSMLYKLGL